MDKTTRRLPIFILLCGLRKAIALLAEAGIQEVWRWRQSSYLGVAVSFPRATGMKIASESPPLEPIIRRRGWRVADVMRSRASEVRPQFQCEQQLIRSQLIHTR